MKNLVISEKAYDDLLGILRYIARDKPQAAVAFVEKLEAQCKFLAACPESGTNGNDLAPDLRVFTYRDYGVYFEICPIGCASNACCRQDWI